ncbi:MAG: hypothetical protein ACRCTJ_05190 [Brevinema sp.]
MKKILSMTFIVLFMSSINFAQNNSISYIEFTSISEDSALCGEDELYTPEADSYAEEQLSPSLLERMSSEDQLKIKDAILEYNFEKTRVTLKFRPALDFAYHERDSAKLELSQLVRQDRDDQAYTEELQKYIGIVKRAEQKVINTKSVEQKSIKVLQTNLRKKIYRIVNNWLLKSVRLTEEEIFDILQAAQTKFGTDPIPELNK